MTRERPMQFDAKAAAQFVAPRGITTTTFMLGSTADVDHGQQDRNSWRRFALDPVLQVNYNKRPNMPSNLAMQSSTLPCAQGANRPGGHPHPELDGVASDPDGGNVTESFGLDQGTVGNYVPNTHHADGQTSVGERGAAEVHDDWITQDGTYTWVAADWDGDLWSDQTSGCEFTVDSLAPPAPTVKMTGNRRPRRAKRRPSTSRRLSHRACTTSTTSSTPPTGPSRTPRPRRGRRLTSC